MPLHRQCGLRLNIYVPTSWDVISTDTSSPVVDHNFRTVFVKSGTQLCRVFLVAADSCHETDFLEAWRNIDDPELVFSPLSHTNDLLLSLKLLDHIRSGFLGAVVLTPPATTWSRLRHCDIPGQVPVRTRDAPAGRAGLSPAYRKSLIGRTNIVMFSKTCGSSFHLPRRFRRPRVEATSGCQ